MFHLERAGGQCFTNISCFIYFVLPETAVKHFVAIYSVLWVHFSYFDQTITEILSIFIKITYLWHTREAAAIFDKTNEQHMQ